MPAYRDLFGGADSVITEGRVRERTIRPQTEVDNLLRLAWQLLAARWAGFINGETNGFLSPDLTDGSAAVRFVRAKYFGEDYPRWLSLVFTPRQFRTASGHKRGKCGSMYEMLGEVAVTDNPNLVDSLRWLTADAPVFSTFASAGLGVRNYRTPLDFPAVLAAEIMDKYCPPGGSVLDPCHGWGGRLVGFLLANNPRHYLGVDPSPAANAGVAAAFEALAPFAESDKIARFMECPFEGAKVSKGAYDLAFTSPPYFDVERYEGDDQSFRKYPTFVEWRTGFYLPLFKGVAAGLKRGGHFAINVGSQSYPLIELAHEYGEKVGLTCLRSQSDLLTGYKAKSTRTADGRSETLLIFRKP